MLGRRPPHAQGPCACGAVLGFVRRPPCGERQGSRIKSARASRGVKRDRTGSPPNDTHTSATESVRVALTRYIGVLAQRDPVSIRLRVSNRVEAIPPPPESGGALGGPGIRQNMRGGGRPPLGVGPDTPVCAQRVLKTRPRRALFCVSLAESGRHSAENTALPGRLTHSLFVNPPPSPTATYGIGHE